MRHMLQKALTTQLTHIAPGIHAYLQLPGGWCLSNSGVVVHRGQVTVIDTASTERRARALREAIRGVSQLPVKLLVNTHHHGDHSFGNFVFADEAAIIGHDRCAVEIAENGLAMQLIWPDVEWGTIKLKPPTITFSDRITVCPGDKRLELIYVGPAHTSNDVIVWLPEEGVLFAGDIAFAGGTPFCLMGSIAGSLSAIRQLRALGARTIVCGHGPVCGPEVLDATEAYLNWLRGLAQDGRKAGLSPLDLAREADLGQFAGLLDPERIVGNLHRAYADSDGTPGGAPLDYPQIMAEMVAYRGGQRLTCLA